MSRELIADILSSGIHVPDTVEGRKGGAGPAEGRAFLIDGVAVNAPIAAPYVARSPYRLQREGDGWLLQKNGRSVGPVDLAPEPRFYRGRTSDGIDYARVALLHGVDCLATTVNQRCVHWKSGRNCVFCGAELSLNNGRTIAAKSPEQLAEVARRAREWDAVSHVVLTTGVENPPGADVRRLARCAEAIKLRTGLPVHAQFAPAGDLDLLELLRDSGVDTVGVHIESFDPDVLSSMAPAKAAIGLDRYKRVWRNAVALFGANQVSSFLIAGLGESPESIISGSELLADFGVYPFIVPLRPIPGTPLENEAPPDVRVMKPIYEAAARILKRKGLSASLSKAGCVRCGACSALPVFEEAPAEIICHGARNPTEKEAALKIRHDVFVIEQKLFETTDVDENDAVCALLVARKGSSIIGTVRAYPADGGKNGHWVGGRLAVKKEHRRSLAGATLVREAVECVKRKGCTRFTAHIQENNVPFFKTLGWKPVGPVETYVNRPHQLMEADLKTKLEI